MNAKRYNRLGVSVNVIISRSKDSRKLDFDNSVAFIRTYPRLRVFSNDYGGIIESGTISLVPSGTITPVPSGTINRSRRAIPRKYVKSFGRQTRVTISLIG